METPDNYNLETETLTQGIERVSVYGFDKITTINAVFAPRSNNTNTAQNPLNNNTLTDTVNNIQSYNNNNITLTENNHTTNTVNNDNDIDDVTLDQEVTKELITELMLQSQGIPPEILIRQIETKHLPDFNYLITTRHNVSPDMTTGIDIPLHPLLPTAMALPVIDFKHDKTPTPITSVKLADKIQKLLDNSFDAVTRQPKKPLNTTKSIFNMFFPNNELVASNANRIINHTTTLIDLTYSLIIKLQVLDKLISNPAARIPSITGYSMPHYSQEYVSQYDCFGSTITSQKKYTELATQLTISTNYNIKMLAHLRITAELEEIKSKVHKIISLTEREWAYLLTHPSQLLEPPDTLPSTPPPIEIAFLHMTAIHMKLRD